MQRLWNREDFTKESYSDGAFGFDSRVVSVAILGSFKAENATGIVSINLEYYSLISNIP